ncbi:MAG: hypothetical protein LBH29_03370 [Elusimicrobiota bacterium]|nr:hypothetical protein [Elusimicrobiota bacterium]
MESEEIKGEQKQEAAAGQEAGGDEKGIGLEPSLTLEQALERAQKKIEEGEGKEKEAQGKEAEEVAAAESKEKGKEDKAKEKQKDIKGAKEAQKGAVEVFAPEKNWSDEQREFFNKLEAADQKKVLDMYKGIQKVYEKKTLEISAQKKELESVDRVLRPYKEMFKAQKQDMGQYIEGLINFDKFASQKPIEFLVDFMIRRGVTLNALSEGIARHVKYNDDPIYKEIKEVKSALSQIGSKGAKGGQSSVEEGDNEAAQAAAAEMVAAFEEQLNDDGSLMHPYFKEARERMAQISQSAGSKDLEELYQQAIWADPDIRLKIIEAERNRAIQAQKINPCIILIKHKSRRQQ